MKNRLAWSLVILIAAAHLVLHLAFYNVLEFHRDELLYFSLGMHPAAGYASVPPLIGWLSWALIHLFSNWLFAAKLASALAGGLLIFLMAVTTKELKGGNFAMVLAPLGFFLTPICLRGFFLYMPLPFELLGWTVFLYFLLRYINTDKTKYLIAAGITAGVILLLKYLLLIFVFALLIGLLLTKHRKILKEKVLYIAILLAALVFLPNLIWQVSKGFPVLIHMRELTRSQLVHVDRFLFLTDILLMVGTSVILLLAGLFFLGFHRQFREYRVFAWSSLIFIGILLFLRGKSYYVIGVVPFLICAGCVAWEKMTKNSIIRGLLIAVLIIPPFFMIPVGIPVFKPARLANYFAYLENTMGFPVGLRDEKGIIHALPQDYSDMIGWEELASITARAYAAVPDKQACLIYCENYGQAGAITVYGRKYGLPDPVCFSESFLYWIPRDFPGEIRYLIYINDELGTDVNKLFADIRNAGYITNPLAREYGTTVWLLGKPRQSFNSFWKVRIAHVNNPFR